eukprot:scaffold19359_cov30-Prasinocladus_malaysianus.AAC.1
MPVRAGAYFEYEHGYKWLEIAAATAVVFVVRTVPGISETKNQSCDGDGRRSLPRACRIHLDSNIQGDIEH